MKSKSGYKHGDKTNKEYTVEAVQALGGEATSAEVDKYLRSRFENYKDNTSANLNELSVNYERRYHYTKTPRRSDDETHRLHKYDQLFKRGSSYELYRPAVHGVYELCKDAQGNFYVRKVKSDFENAVESASKLTSEQRINYLVTANKTPDATEVITRVLKRNPYVVAEALFRANGKCQHCERDAPFKRENGTPYLEVHHIEWLAKGGEDSIENTIALCPNCHRQAHFGVLELSKVNADWGK